ncbi:MAG TPA: hypothetical protein VFB60_28360 [Ktedonobacteraceae bacterium]|nr:hypothetical protein [Ktedonobacteraceae bacterium]
MQSFIGRCSDLLLMLLDGRSGGTSRLIMLFFLLPYHIRQSLRIV